jgi:hypothetical protein
LQVLKNHAVKMIEAARIKTRQGSGSRKDDGISLFDAVFLSDVMKK